MALIRTQSRAQQRQIDLTTAVCQERLLSTHVRHVVALVDVVAEHLPFDAALDIYARVLKLTPEQARNVGSRALAAIGRRNGLPDIEDPDVDLMEDEPDEPRPTPGSGRFDEMFSRVRRRIQGRVQDELRQRINLAAARAEDDLFLTHVDNALLFARAMADEMALHEAVDLYLDILSVPEGVSDVVFNRALRTVADDVLPPVARTRVPKREDDSSRATGAAPVSTPAAEPAAS